MRTEPWRPHEVLGEAELAALERVRDWSLGQATYPLALHVWFDPTTPWTRIYVRPAEHEVLEVSEAARWPVELALWKATGAVHRVNEYGAVIDPEIDFEEETCASDG